MKKLILVIAIVFFASNSYSQYLIDGLKWNNTTGGTDDWGVNLHRNFTYKVEGDTTIGGVDYKLVKKNYPDINQEWTTAFCLREDSRKWYIIGAYEPYISDEVLLYDFSLEIGDSIYNAWAQSYSSIIEHGDTVLENGQTRKYLILGEDNLPPTMNDMWIEGLGSASCHVELPCFYLNIIDACAISLCASNNNELLFTSFPNLNCYDSGGNFITSLNKIEQEDNSITLYPNPASKEVNISSESIINSIEVFNSFGQRIYQEKTKLKEKTIDISSFSKGVYIIGVNTDRGYIRKKLIKQ
ncbi:MAG: T9SS type A sorting domain-containing protein [Bacteroidales bacterium]|nr:T9SS type A sorting domain-containing protein [Bacteroidales bacterium]MDD4738372.1 T9SS type A sorting domain-containing protein [Bacteroidales bacterium]